MSSSKKIDLSSDFAADVYPSVLNPSPLPPFHTIYVHALIHTGRGEMGESSTREKVRGAKVYKAGSKIPT
jgi:hypothetical protein